jgi:hypothetical protein
MLAEAKGLTTRSERLDIINPSITLIYELKRIALDLPKSSKAKTSEAGLVQ